VFGERPRKLGKGLDAADIIVARIVAEFADADVPGHARMLHLLEVWEASVLRLEG
jgi:hypothetical protein